MYINLTLFIQIINLIVTYYVLDRLLFKPFLALITKKKELRDGLVSFLAKEEETLLALDKQKRDELCSFQDHVQHNYPVPQSEHDIIPRQVALQHDNLKIDALVERARDTIIDKVSP